MTDAKGPSPTVKLWCHWHVSTSTSHSFLLTPGSGCDKKMQHILFLTFHFSTQVCKIFWSHPHCLLFYFLLCDGHFKPPPCPPPDPFITSLGELSPFSCGQHQSPWGLSYQRQPSLHITQLTRQQPKPGSFQRSRQPRAKPPATQWMDHLAVVSQGWKPHRHHFSVPKWQWILKGFVRPWRHD